MRGRIAWVVLGLLVLAGGLWYLRGGHGPARNNNTPSPAPAQAVAAAGHPGTIATTVSNTANVLTPGQELKYRLSNTTKRANDLLRNDRAILLANAVIDTTRPLDALNIPDKLRAPADNGSWIVQANGPLSAPFRSLLAGAGAQVISYIPNNAELVLAPASVAQSLAASTLVASVVPYEPYYKLTDPALLKLAVTGADLPPDVGLRLGVFTGAQGPTMTALAGLGAEVVGSEPSPFGVTLDVHPANGTFLDVARLPGVMVVEAMHRRFSANDLFRMRVAASVNTVTNNDYLSLSGLGVFVNVNDSDVDAGNPDFAPGRITLDPTATGQDPNGHGTHVIGTILGNGSQSGTVGTNAQGSATNANFRGMATNATAYVISLAFDTRPQSIFGAPLSDAYLQETAGRTNVFISNNSWDYEGDASYDMAAASYDASVRDAVPEITGPQPLLYVFAAGNSGSAATDGSGGIADTILSPATAKNVITVGSIEQLRKITNAYVVDGATNQAWFVETDNSNQVADFSSRGNVGVGIEGPSGRFKPDVIAPGTFVLSDKSAQWNQSNYYNPTNFTFNTQFNQTVTNGGLSAYSIVIPANAVSFTVSALSNDFSPTPFPALPVYIGFSDNPTTNVGGFDAMGSGSVTLTLTSTPPLPVGSRIFYSVGNQTNGFVSFDVQTLVETTNDNGNLLTVLSNLNQSLGAYRYESGTSMSAAGVSGMLALMQEFFEKRLNLTTHSPALMKALLINGARTLGSQYDFNVTGAVTSQGWGLPNLSNSIPGVLTNGGANVPMQFFDQTTNMLATGDSKTRLLKLANGLGSQPLRVTLVWTDPPGNPAAGVKLVNDLDLIVTNTDNQTVFFGNDIPAGSAYNVTRSATNNPTNFDSVNNVENVYLFPPLGTNYSITVFGRRVNVNAVDSNTNGVVQDYALVVSYGDGGAFTNAFSMTDQPVVSSNNAGGLTVVTNGLPLLNQRVGGNSQFVWVPGTATNGVGNQWKFYVYTNTPSLTNAAFTNVAFVTFDPPNLGVPRMGTREEADPANGVRTEADIDLYVSTDPNLTNLVPSVVNAAFQSLSRTGTEKVLLTNQPAGQVYYAGVKSEDQEGAQFGFVAVALTNSFGQQDSNGNVTLTLLAPVLPTPIPTGTAAHPGSVTVLALTTVDLQARKVVVEDTIQHQEFGDLVGAVSHEQKSVVLNNHSFFDNPSLQVETFLYDDTGEVDDPFLLDPPFNLAVPLPANPGVPRHSDGPGVLTSFTGDNISDGIWTFSMVNDSSPNDTGFINNLVMFVEPQQPTNGFLDTIAADSWFYDFIDVPANATNLIINTGISTSGPVDVYLRRGAFPDAGDFDKFELINAPGAVMTLGLFDSPPLNPGRYFIGVFNPTPTRQTVNVQWTFGLAQAAPQPLEVLSAGNEPIPDDAVMYSTNYVGQNSQVVSVEAGVRINHPRESDLVLTLISPSGTRVLLAENRGGLDDNGYGSGVNITNFIGSTTSGSFSGATNIINVGTNSGTLLINYNMFTVPDDLRVYYGGARIFDSGLISGAGNFAIDFGPGASTSVTVVMNELGTNPNTNDETDAWQYQVSEISKNITYATFTEDTNKTTTPIKFAVPPFGGGPAFTVPVTNMQSSFEVAAGDYAAPATVDGWNVVDTNPVKVVSVNLLAADEVNPLAGNNVLALHHGGILRQLPTIAGQSYTLSFAYHGRPEAGPYNGPDPVAWWKGDGNANDSSGNVNDGTLFNGVFFTNGLVNQAFQFGGGSQQVDVSASASLNVGAGGGYSIEGWIEPLDLSSNEPLVEWNDGGGVGNPDLGPHFWINQPTTSNGGGLGSLFANIVDNVGAGNWHTLNSGPNLLSTTAFQHVAITFDKTSGAAVLYYNGAAVGNASFPGITPRTAAPYNLYLGFRPFTGIYPSQAYRGLMDEMTVYGNALTPLQIQDIYAAGSAGKWLPSQSGLMVAANVILGGQSLSPITGNDYWTSYIYTFTAPSNNTVLEIQSLTNNDGVLVDSFQLVANPTPNTNNYYLPEETLSALTGEPAQGNWQLEVLDNRLGATNPPPMLVSWQLSLGLERVNPPAQILSNAVPVTNTVLPGFITYFVVNVPPWAQFATNILTVTGGGPASLLFNQGALPGLTNGDFNLLPNVTAPNTGTATLGLATIPPLVPGSQYYLAVTNSGAAPATFALEVDFGNITPLFNLTPVTGTILPITTQPNYFYFDVPAATPAATFLLYNLSGNVDLYAIKGLPLPTQSSFNYDSVNPGTNDDIITIAPNSLPVPLSTGRWYLGVFNDDVAPVNYTIEAVILTPTIIPLTNDQRLTMTGVTPLASQETFFSFDITTAPAGALFEIYGMSGNVDLDLDFNTLPYTAMFFASSTNPGTNDEQIVIRANTPPAGATLNGLWYLGAPSQVSSNVTYTIHAVVTDTNGLLVSAVPIQPVVALPVNLTTGPTLTWNTVTGECYDVYYSFDLINWTLLPIFPMPVNAGGTTISVTDPAPITGVPAKYYKIVQVVCP
jgi:subtilisin-like proprotein convertase family protein